MSGAFRISDSLRRQLGRVAVFMGGDSAERPISLKSGHAVEQALLEAGVDARGVDIRHEQLLDRVRERDFDRVFIALHGRGGEDGSLQAVLDQADIPYTGSEVMASALAMDKLRTKYVFAGAGLPTPGFRLMTGLAEAPTIIEALGTPLVVKPAREGSSIGVRRVNDEAELEAAFGQAAAHDPLVLVEQWVTGEEYTVAILGDEPLPVIGLRTDHAFYDFDAKYQSNDTRYLLPCGLGEADERALQDLALQAFRVVGASGWGRVDVMRDPDGLFWLLEINTVPGMTDHSLVPMAAQAAGIGFPELVVRILTQTLDRGGEPAGSPGGAP